MNAKTGGEPPREGDLLAPWRVVDRLDEDDAALFDRLMREDPRLAHGLDLAAEERDATVDANEALPTPSVAARDALFARIAEERPASGFAGWLAGVIQSLSPSALAWSATAAACLIVVQAGLLAFQLTPDEGRFTTASHGQGAEPAGQRALVAFAPTATAEEIAALLREERAEIVGGPKAGGMFVIRLAGVETDSELAAALDRLRARGATVRVAVPAGDAAR